MRCQCYDPACSVAHGAEGCHAQAQFVLFRRDMTDEEGVEMCGPCSADALESGVFFVEDEPDACEAYIGRH